jgi:hypothetical protein
LVCDADGRNLRRLDACFPQRLSGGVHLGAPDCLRIVLHPAGLRKDLGKLLLRNADNAPIVIKNDCPGTGGPLI